MCSAPSCGPSSISRFIRSTFSSISHCQPAIVPDSIPLAPGVVASLGSASLQVNTAGTAALGIPPRTAGVRFHGASLSVLNLFVLSGDLFFGIQQGQPTVTAHQAGISLFDILPAEFSGLIDGSGVVQMESDELAFNFDLGVVEARGGLEFAFVASAGGGVAFEGHFAGELWKPALLRFDSDVLVGTITAEISDFGCMTLNASFFDIELPLPSHFAITPGACAPHVSVADKEVLEGDSKHSIQLEVRSNVAAPTDIVVNYVVEAISGGTRGLPAATAGHDFVAASGLVTITKGSLTTQIQIEILGDTEFEGNEAFRVRLESAVGASIGSGTAVITIVDDDLGHLVEQLVQQIEDGLQPLGNALVFYDFQRSDGSFQTAADRVGPFIAASSVTHASGLISQSGLPSHEPVQWAAAGSSHTSSIGQRYFEFTLELNHNEPLLVGLNQLEFWHRPGASLFPVGPLEVRWSLDGFATPLVTSQTLVIDHDWLVAHGFPANEPLPLSLTSVAGWTRSRFGLSGRPESPSYVTALPLPVTFRIIESDFVGHRIDNVQVTGGISDPCETELELQCAAQLVGDVLEWIDTMVGRVTVEVIGGGRAIGHLWPPADPGNIDPSPQQLLRLELVDTVPGRTEVVVRVQNPRGLTGGRAFPLGEIVSDNGVLRIDVSQIPLVEADINMRGTLGEARFDSLADGSRIRAGGGSRDTLLLSAKRDIGNRFGGAGVDLEFGGRVQVDAHGWYGGRWQVGEVSQAVMRNGSFTADVLIERGFGVFETRGGDFAPRRFESGRGLGDGSGGAIRAVASGGLGGNVLIGKASIGGNLESLVARGGAIEVNLAANRVGLVHATSEASDGLLRPAAESGVHGTFTVMSVDQVTAEGSDITASFTTSDSLHMQMEMTAESDPFGGGGAIYSPYSFLIAGGVALIRATDMEFTLVAGRDVGVVEALTDAFGRPGRLVGNLTAPRFGVIRVLGDRLDVNLFATHPGLSQVDQVRFDWLPSTDPEQDTQLFVELLGLGASTRLVWDASGGPSSGPMRVVTSQTAVVAGHAAGARVAGLSLPLSLGGQPLAFTVSDPRLEIRDGQLWLKADQQLDPDSEPQLIGRRLGRGRRPCAQRNHLCRSAAGGRLATDRRQRRARAGSARATRDAERAVCQWPAGRFPGHRRLGRWGGRAVGSDADRWRSHFRTDPRLRGARQLRSPPECRRRTGRIGRDRVDRSHDRDRRSRPRAADRRHRRRRFDSRAAGVEPVSSDCQLPGRALARAARRRRPDRNLCRGRRRPSDRRVLCHGAGVDVRRAGQRCARGRVRFRSPVWRVGRRRAVGRLGRRLPGWGRGRECPDRRARQQHPGQRRSPRFAERGVGHLDRRRRIAASDAGQRSAPRGKTRSTRWT
jgi:hypothetical protein